MKHISALEHYVYCPRQCALIYQEQVFDENIYTLKGDWLHKKVDEARCENSYDMRIEYAMPLYSEELNIVGKADLVEFHKDGTIYPVEYKSGKRRYSLAEKVQLCAQALSLEEMLNVKIEKGALFWFGSKRRTEVKFTPKLREQTIQAIRLMSQMLDSRELPPPLNNERCKNCSLIDACMPQIREWNLDYNSLFQDN